MEELQLLRGLLTSLLALVFEAGQQAEELYGEEAISGEKPSRARPRAG